MQSQSRKRRRSDAAAHDVSYAGVAPKSDHLFSPLARNPNPLFFAVIRKYSGGPNCPKDIPEDRVPIYDESTGICTLEVTDEVDLVNMEKSIFRGHLASLPETIPLDNDVHPSSQNRDDNFDSSSNAQMQSDSDYSSADELGDPPRRKMKNNVPAPSGSTSAQVHNNAHALASKTRLLQRKLTAYDDTDMEEFMDHFQLGGYNVFENLSQQTSRHLTAVYNHRETHNTTITNTYKTTAPITINNITINNNTARTGETINNVVTSLTNHMAPFATTRVISNVAPDSIESSPDPFRHTLRSTAHRSTHFQCTQATSPSAFPANIQRGNASIVTSTPRTARPLEQSQPSEAGRSTSIARTGSDVNARVSPNQATLREPTSSSRLATQSEDLSLIFSAQPAYDPRMVSHQFHHLKPFEMYNTINPNAINTTGDLIATFYLPINVDMLSALDELLSGYTHVTCPLVLRSHVVLPPSLSQPLPTVEYVCFFSKPTRWQMKLRLLCVGGTPFSRIWQGLVFRKLFAGQWETLALAHTAVGYEVIRVDAQKK